MPSQDFDFARRNDFLNELRAGQITDKRSLREKLEKDLTKYEKQGGTVTEIPSNPRVPRQPCSNPQPYPARKNPKPFYDYKYNCLMRQWLSAVEGRSVVLAALSGYSEPWISLRRRGFNQLLVAPISGVFGSHNSLDATAHFYKSLFERGWPLLVCLDSDDACVYLQVLHFILLDLYMTT